jgi:uncharacterized protein YggE
MKRQHLLLAVAVIGFAALSLALASGDGVRPAPVVAQAAEREPGLITVRGDADVRVPPDQVVLTLGVETQHRELAQAKSQNDEAVRALLAVAEAYEIPARHVHTDFFAVNPVYENEYSPRRVLAGYQVLKSVVITLSDVSRFEDLLSDALESGANHVHNVEFRTTELREHRDAARALAIQAAREKAQALTAELGLAIGEPRTIIEEYSGWYSAYNSWWGYRSGGGMSQNVVQQVGSASYEPDSTVAPGQIAVNARVSVSFEIVH